MSDRIPVRTTNRNLFGEKIAGPSGAIYSVQPSGALHLMIGDGVDSEPGCLKPDADRFALFSKFRVTGAKKAAPPPPKKPVTLAASGEAASGDSASDGDSPDPTPEEAETSLVFPDDTDKKDAWLSFARSNGLALSPRQKKMKKAEVIEAVRDLADAKDSA